MFPDIHWYGHFFLFWYVELMPRVCQHLSVIPCMVLNGRIKVWTGKKVKGKAIPVTGHDSPQGYETSRLPHFLDNQLTDSYEVVCLTCRPPFNPRKIPGAHFCYRLIWSQGVGRIRSTEKSSDLMGNWTHNLLALASSTSTNYATTCPMNWKEYGKKWSWPEILPWCLSEGTEDGGVAADIQPSTSKTQA
jgi:hypothetical protein